MKTVVLSADAASIARAAEVIRQGGLVAFPTETVYGLGAHALKAAAVARIFEAKGRPPTNPIIVHVAEIEQIAALTGFWPAVAWRLAAVFWPGPLTLVVARSPAVPDIVTAGGPTVALRIPAHPVALALLRSAAVPIAAPSANLSSMLSPTRPEHVLRGLDGCIDLLLDGGPTPGGLESTVLDLTADPPRLLRPGLIDVADIESLIGPIQVDLPARSEVLPSPGMLARHYAPRTPLQLLRADQLRSLPATAEHIALLALTASRQVPGVHVIAMPIDPAAYAGVLFATLHTLDDGRFDRIVVELPPDLPEWLAVRDRLRRAAN